MRKHSKGVHAMDSINNNLGNSEPSTETQGSYTNTNSQSQAYSQQPQVQSYTQQTQYGEQTAQQQFSGQTTQQMPQTQNYAQQTYQGSVQGSQTAQAATQQQQTQAYATYTTVPLQANQSGQASHAQAKAKQASPVKSFVFAFVGALLACALVLGGFTLTGGFGSGTSTSVVLGSQTSTPVSASDDDATLAESVSSKCLPSVVSIDVYTKSQSSSYFYGYGSSSDESSLTESSLGSGVVLSEDGYVITNYHVVEGSDALQATVEGKTYEAELVGSDASSDIAVIKLKDASGLTPIELGDSDNLTIGEWVMSIGSPFGLEQSVATGIVSATSRSQIVDNSSSNTYGYSQSSSGSSYTIYPNMIQTDAAINPGNSGGALVDDEGKLIGINTLITSYSGNYSGVGFAIPVNYAVNIAQQIIEGKTPTHAQLGVSLTTIDSQTAARYNLSASQGAYISAIYGGSGAENAGLQEGDIVTAADGEDISSASDLMLAVRAKNPGDTITLSVNRSGQTLSIDVTLGSDEASQAASSSNSNSGSRSNSGSGSGSGSGSSGSNPWLR